MVEPVIQRARIIPILASATASRAVPCFGFHVFGFVFPLFKSEKICIARNGFPGNQLEGWGGFTLNLCIIIDKDDDALPIYSDDEIISFAGKNGVIGIESKREKRVWRYGILNGFPLGGQRNRDFNRFITVIRHNPFLLVEIDSGTKI
ncbi:hypothetical protein [Salidesulfovibrio onnuriiensis]|uniref:hypothetical protein n=1 Tax=Salidesulfovibrio onnuriiensis TaxID=2583823 RepID=UPI00164FE1A2|nr:hypothetical protein [Salidesulfovibrio onnuriiensis]